MSNRKLVLQGLALHPRGRNLGLRLLCNTFGMQRASLHDLLSRRALPFIFHLPLLQFGTPCPTPVVCSIAISKLEEGAAGRARPSLRQWRFAQTSTNDPVGEDATAARRTILAVALLRRRRPRPRRADGGKAAAAAGADDAVDAAGASGFVKLLLQPPRLPRPAACPPTSPAAASEAAADQRRGRGGRRGRGLRANGEANQ
mmetsp:Transcript_101406/g.326861  ORF Transcript_101406/g.326861 Transcript_101406/m.326861 type:complete len:201 (+) Transcript_101406:1248-1850(+)